VFHRNEWLERKQRSDEAGEENRRRRVVQDLLKCRAEGRLAEAQATWHNERLRRGLVRHHEEG